MIQTETILIVQTVAIVCSAVAAVFLVNITRSQSKKRATVEALLHLRLDSDYINDRREFMSLVSDEDNLAKYASKEHANSLKTQLIFRILNYQEYLATGISEQAFDEEIYKRMSYSSCIKTWSRLEAFVIKLRRVEGRNTLFQEFESLVDRWTKKPLKK